MIYGRLDSYFMLVTAWSIGFSVFGVILMLTRRFWEKHTSAKWRVRLYTFSYLLFLLVMLIGVSIPKLSISLFTVNIPHSAASDIPAFRSTDWSRVFVHAWLTGIGCVALTYAVSYARFRYWLKKCRRPASERVRRMLEKIEVQGDRRMWLSKADVLDEDFKPDFAISKQPEIHTLHEIYVVDGLPGPMSVISGRKCLLLDREDYDDETLDAIIRHELAHLDEKAQDLARLGTGLCTICWFNPMGWILQRYIRDEVELLCDELANARRAEDKRASYAKAMVSLAANRSLFAPATAQMACGEKLLTRRVQAVLTPDNAKTSKPASAALLALMIACLMLICGVPYDTQVDESNFLSYLLAPTERLLSLGIGGKGLYEADSVGFDVGVSLPLDYKSIVSELYLDYSSEEARDIGGERLEADISKRLGASGVDVDGEVAWVANGLYGDVELRLAFTPNGRRIWLYPVRTEDSPYYYVSYGEYHAAYGELMDAGGETPPPR